MIVATAGHVDHGKSSLVKHLTGVETDTLAEEKARGLSINLGFAYYRFQDKNPLNQKLQDQLIGFVDVPGHSDFINNMLAGVAAVDFALLVVAVDDGVMPQTREHLSILDHLGITDGAVVLTKTDIVEQARVDEVKNEIESLLLTHSLHGSPVFSVSNISGEGIPPLLSFLEAKASFYSNDSNTVTASPDADLQAYLEQSKFQKLPPLNQQKCRFSIDRVFTVKGIGTVVTGTVVAGCVNVDEKLRHAGGTEVARIKGIRIHEQSVNSGQRGQRLALNISLSHHHIKRGDWLLDEALMLPVKSFDALIKLTGIQEKKINRNVLLHLHHFSGHRLVNVKVLKYEKDSSAEQDGKTWVNIKLSKPLYCLSGDRFILRDASASTTIAGGEVVDVFPPQRHVIDKNRLSYLHDLRQGAKDSLTLLLETQKQGVNFSMFSAAKNFHVNNESAVDGVLEEGAFAKGAFTTGGADQGVGPLRELLSDSEISTSEMSSKRYILLTIPGPFPKVLLHLKYFGEFAEQALLVLKDYHLNHSDRQGMSEFALLKACTYSGSFQFFKILFGKLLEINLVSRTGTFVHLADHQASLDKDDLILFRKLETILLDAGTTAPRTGELVELLQYDQRVLDSRLKGLCEKGHLFQVFKNRFYLLSTIVEIAGIVETLAESQSNGEFSVIQFRDESGIGRNLCIQLLEFFDRQGFTRRLGDRRVIRQVKGSVFVVA